MRWIRSRTRRCRSPGWFARVSAAGVLVASALAGCSTHGAAVPGPLVLAATPPPGSLSLLVEPDQGIDPVYALLRSARRSIDLTMYELVDATLVQVLEGTAARGVAVRVVLDVNREKTTNTPAYETLRAHGVHVAWADHRYLATHQKTAVIDGALAAVMSLNLASRYYPGTRDFAVLDRRAADVAEIARVFDADYAHRTVSPQPARDLLWSPGAESTLLHLIDSAHSTLAVENEEMALPAVTSALERAARRGVRVTLVMSNRGTWDAQFTQLARAGVDVRSPPAAADLYIHAKAIVADADSASGRAFVGSQNFSAASLGHNRELGIVTADPALVHRLAATIAADAAIAGRQGAAATRTPR